MMRSEREVADSYERNGYSALHRGAPDFLMVHRGADGGITEVIAVEVKTGKSQLSPEQELWREALTWLGVQFVVERREAMPGPEFNYEAYARSLGYASWADSCEDMARVAREKPLL